MRVFKDPNNETTWCVTPHGADEERLLETILTALAQTYPEPPPPPLLPEVVLERIAGTSQPETATEVVARLNLGPDSQANLAQLYEWCKTAESLTNLQKLVDELVSARVIRARFCVMDPSTGYGLEIFDDRKSVPQEMEDTEGLIFEVRKDDIQVVYVRNEEMFGEAS